VRILLLGANGQVGFELAKTLLPLGELILATRTGFLPGGIVCESVDLVDSNALVALLDHVQPGVIVNATAYTAVDRAEDEPALADQINHQALYILGKWGRENNCKIIHYSTDYVFDGAASQPYREEDIPAPLNVYGRSKLAGEVALHTSGAEYLIFRTAWVYGARGKNFLRTVLRLANERDQLRVVNDQWGAPTPCGFIATASTLTLGRWLAMSEQKRRAHQGTYHLVTSEQCTWFEFTCEIVNLTVKTKILQRMPEIIPITTQEFPTKAKRPAYSVLSTQKIQTVFGIYMPAWQQVLKQLISEIAEAKLIAN